jgi:regulatory protein
MGLEMFASHSSTIVLCMNGAPAIWWCFNRIDGCGREKVLWRKIDWRPMAFKKSSAGGFKPKKIKPPLDVSGLLEFAVRSLSSQMKSVRDLRFRMKGRAEPGEAGEDAIEAVILKLKELGYLSDERFAADFTRLRKENQKFGQRRVQQGLMQKGIAQELTNSTLKTAYEDVDEVALAKEYVERKRMKKPEGDKEIARAMRRLMSAGFSTKTIWKVLRGWGAEVEEVDVDESEE